CPRGVQRPGARQMADGCGPIASRSAESPAVYPSDEGRSRFIREVRFHTAQGPESVHGNCGPGSLQTTVNQYQSPIACQLNALTADERKRRAELFSALSGSAGELQELPDGYAIRFAPEAEIWMGLAEFIMLERRCCPFLAFSLSAEEEN